MHMTLDGYPILFLEIQSVDAGVEQQRMQLQAACLVRLGSALLSESDEFVVKAIYIDNNFRAIEHTLHQTCNKNSMVVVPFIAE